MNRSFSPFLFITATALFTWFSPALSNPLSYELRNKTIGHPYPIQKGVPERIIQNGSVDSEQYIAYLVDMHHVIRYLEEQMQSSSYSNIASLNSARTGRTAAISKDLGGLQQLTSISTPRPGPAATEYVQYLQSIQQSHRLIAHIWVVYQFLARSGWRAGTTIGKDLQIGLETLNLYGYGGNLKTMQANLRNRLDEISLSKQEKKDLLHTEIPIAMQKLDQLLKKPTN